MTATSRFRTLSRLALIPAALLALAPAGPLLAQDAGLAGGLNLPQNPEIFGKQDPNHRTATVIINGEVITGTDIDQRLALIVAASGNKIAPEEVERVRLQVLRNLMDETLQIQEAKSQDLKVEDEEVEASYDRVARQNFGQDPKALDAYLVKIGSSAASLKRQIRGELSWDRLRRRNVVPFVNVSDDEVRETIKRQEAAKGTDEYRVGEIFLSANSENRNAVLQNAQKIVEQLKNGGNFVAYARQFSEASTAVVGGDLGWIRPGMLPQEIDQALLTMQPNQLVGPIEIRGGFSIILLIDKRKVLTADPRDAVLSLKQVLIQFPAGTTETQARDKANAFAEGMKSIRGCGTVDPIAKQYGAEVVSSDQIKARDLPPALQNMVLALNVGEATQPFGSIKDGVSVLVLCGRDDPQAAGGPTFEQVEDQLLDERTQKRAQTYLRDLRRDAVIDYGN